MKMAFRKKGEKNDKMLEDFSSKKWQRANGKWLTTLFFFEALSLFRNDKHETKIFNFMAKENKCFYSISCLQISCLVKFSKAGVLQVVIQNPLDKSVNKKVSSV